MDLQVAYALDKYVKATLGVNHVFKPPGNLLDLKRHVRHRFDSAVAQQTDYTIEVFFMSR